MDFNYLSKSRGGGAANIKPAKGEYVEGVLFNLSENDKNTIALKKGAPNYYYEISILKDGANIKDVKTYTVCNNKKGSNFVPPTTAYKQIIIEGAKTFGLTEEWIKKLEAIYSVN